MSEKCENAPSAECQLYVEKLVRPIAEALIEVTSTMENFRENYERTAKTVHGENYDNGMVQAVIEHTAALEAVEKLPDEVRKLITRWGFFILGANGALSAIAIGILIKFFGGE